MLQYLIIGWFKQSRLKGWSCPEVRFFCDLEVKRVFIAPAAINSEIHFFSEAQVPLSQGLIGTSKLKRHRI